ncbi:MAG: acyl-CoA dehydrogenase family protein [Lautropia sp.]
MIVEYSSEEQAFREEVRAWLAANVPEDLKARVLSYGEFSKQELARWHRILAGKGWIAPSWPLEWGGCGWGPMQRYIYEEESAFAAAPPVLNFGIGMCGPVLLQYGTEAQKRRFLPPIYNGDEFWCQGYSEPSAGSDLASLGCRAERQGDRYIVNGQKTWTTFGHYADWIFCLLRTDRAAPRKQEGISFILIDMRSPGIEVRPLPLLDEGHEVNEVFFDNVSVPVENRVGAEGEGWSIAKYLLGHERLNTGRVAISQRELGRIRAMAGQIRPGGGCLLDDVRFRDRLSRLEVDLMALEVTNLRYLDQMRRQGRIGPEVSLLKIQATEIQQRITELMLDAVGPDGERFKPGRDGDGGTFGGAVAARYLNFRKASIYGGSNEIQRNIYARAVLGL